jgi:AraC-like DNA-binding protein
MIDHVLGESGRASKEGKEDLAVRRAKEYLIANYGLPVTLEDLVEETGVDRFRLLRAFKRRVGVTPHAFLLRVRVTKAERMIAEGLSCSEAAASAGFADQSHMIRCFKNCLGVTPGRHFAR